jgi:hypothetical protein
MWPFSKTLSEEQSQRLFRYVGYISIWTVFSSKRTYSLIPSQLNSHLAFLPRLSTKNRKCSLALQTLSNCRQANGDNISACANLETQVVYCHSEVLSPKLAKEYQKCFRSVINSKGKLPVSHCDTHIAAMKKSLRKYRVYPFK